MGSEDCIRPRDVENVHKDGHKKSRKLACTISLNSKLSDLEFLISGWSKDNHMLVAA